jgi:hypothetical protein
MLAVFEVIILFPNLPVANAALVIEPLSRSAWVIV